MTRRAFANTHNNINCCRSAPRTTHSCQPTQRLVQYNRSAMRQCCTTIAKRYVRGHIALQMITYLTVLRGAHTQSRHFRTRQTSPSTFTLATTTHAHCTRATKCHTRFGVGLECEKSCAHSSNCTLLQLSSSSLSTLSASMNSILSASTSSIGSSQSDRSATLHALMMNLLKAQYHNDQSQTSMQCQAV